jgi:hypothetical protein
MKIIYVASTEGPRRRAGIVVDSPLVRGILSEQELQKAGKVLGRFDLAAAERAAAAD